MKITAEVASNNTTRLFADDRSILLAFKATGCPRQRDQRARCWLIPSNRADDVLTYCEYVLGAEIELKAAS
jgi:hypothetical protein